MYVKQIIWKDGTGTKEDMWISESLLDGFLEVIPERPELMSGNRQPYLIKADRIASFILADDPYEAQCYPWVNENNYKEGEKEMWEQKRKELLRVLLFAGGCTKDSD